ncbi:family 32 glycoside hydrolase [Phyllosticta citricarpa]
MSDPSDTTSNGYSRLSPVHASADAIPLLVDETYHLFHLTTPPNTRHHPARLRSPWTRLRSQDLRKWTRDAEPAITPSKNASAPDADGAWTGSAIIGPDNTMHIFYTGYNLSQNGRQVIRHAQSTDRHGTSFTKNASPITITSPATHRAAFEAIDFRDPFVFYHTPTSSYWMLVATRLASGPYWTRGCLALLTSPDLCSWSLDPTPFFAPNDLFCPECPELFALPNGRWYLVYSRFAAPHPGTVYRVADSARGPFRVPRDGCGGVLDGRRWYAAKSCAKKGDPSKRVFFGWTGDWCAADGKWLWGGDLALPREVYAEADGSLRMQPVPEALDALLESSSSHSSVAALAGPLSTSSLPSSSSLSLSAIGTTCTYFLNLPHPHALLLRQQHPNLYPYLLTFSPTLSPSSILPASFGILLRTSPSLRGHRIVFRPLFLPTTTSTTSPSEIPYAVILQTDIAPLDDFWADQYGLYVPRGVDGPEVVRIDGVRLGRGVRLLMQNDVLQCFVGGRALTYRLPPLPSPSVAAGEDGKEKEEEAERYGVDGVDGEDGDENGNENEVKELGFFVQDGEVVFEGLSIR